MKANKIFAVALAALTLVGFNACKPGQQGGGSDNPDQPGQEATLALDKTSISLEVEGEETITATIEVSFESSDPTVASVTPANDGKSAKVTALKEGSAVITAKSKGGQVKTCVVAVKKKGGDQPQGGGDAVIKAKRIWPIILDGIASEANASKIAGDFRPNDNDNNLWIWPDGSTYAGVDAIGLNYFGNNEGYTALVVGNVGWSGLGFCIENPTAVAAAQELVAAIVANPDKFFLHFGIKSTDNGSHQCYVFNEAAGRSFVLGANAIEADKNPYMAGDFERDGAWHGYDIPMSNFVNALSTYSFVSGHNILCVLSGGTANTQLNMDAIYFYEVE